MLKKCSFCKKEFNKSKNLKTKHNFCSKTCWRRWLKEIQCPKVSVFKKGHKQTNTGRTWFKKGQTTSPKQKEIARKSFTGKNNPRWKPIGSKHNSHGYIEVKIGPNEWIKEHILVAERKIGRKLYRDECVHHKNGNKSDNRPKNLQVMLKKEHKKLHLKDNLLKRYAKNSKN